MRYNSQVDASGTKPIPNNISLHYYCLSGWLDSLEYP